MNKIKLLDYLNIDEVPGKTSIKLDPCPICGHNDCFTYYADKDEYYCISEDHNRGGNILQYCSELYKDNINLALYNIVNENIPILSGDNPLLLLKLIKESKISVSKKRNLLTKVIHSDLIKNGKFFKSKNNQYFYKLQAGILYEIEEKSTINTDFDSFLMKSYELNKAESIYSYLMNYIITHIKLNAEEVDVRRFVYYNKNENILYLQCGLDHYYEITTDTVKKYLNGTAGIIFEPKSAPREFNYLEEVRNTSLEHWKELFINNINFSNDTSGFLNPNDSRLLLELYIRYIPFAYSMSTKPLLAFIGDKGSGKTLTLKILFSIINGQNNFHVVGMNSRLEKDWNTLITKNYFFVLDNCDAQQKTEWLADNLAAISTGQRIQTRELYTTNNLASFDVNCLVCLTAMEPAFKRIDVNQRLLIFKGDPILNSQRISEDKILKKILDKRNVLMSELINNIQQSLVRLKKNAELAPNVNIRSADFSDFIFRIINEEERKYFPILMGNIEKSQSYLSIEDNLIIFEIERLLEKGQIVCNQKISTTELYSIISSNLMGKFEFQSQYTLSKFSKSLHKMISEINKCASFHIQWLGQGTGNKTYITIARKTPNNLNLKKEN
ncbi:MAG: hypothetical protein JXQ65_09585 [Candidatus Marinimicrobia bacterium]|nr:hypothetical protein [Candidatus Neomarinimicrobiota bacterium]